ncbi:MAG: hypothetical protein GQ474_10855 [Sulfurimonas sp.]|nr:hypothetical protein [Sulfurimonas sp.]
MTSFVKNEHLAHAAFYTIFFLTAIFLISHHLYGEYPCDTRSHLNAIQLFMDGKSYIPHPLWHLSVYYISYITVEIKLAAILFTSFLMTGWVLIIHRILYHFFCESNQCTYNSYQLLMILTVIVLIGPAYFPLYNDYIYKGIGSPNVWHNATLFTVKPFALLTVFFSVLGLKYDNIKYYILAVVFFVVSMFAKPSFAIVFIPALVIYFILKKEYANKKLIFICLTLVIFLLIVGYQFISAYGSSDSKIIIDFLGVWSTKHPNVLFAIFTALFFPLMFLLLSYKISLKDDWIVFSWIMMIISIFYFATFAEEGPRYKAGNFGWGYQISLSILYIFSIISFMRIRKKVIYYKRYILYAILFYQWGIGVFYIGKILNGLHYG